MRLITLLATVALLCSGAFVAHAAIADHQITALPGWNGTLPSKQYSGYISVDDAHGRYLHYWFVFSEQNPSSDPVVLWLNGGPGCSSLDGFLYEHGPFIMVDTPTGTGRPNLEIRPERWSQIANVLYLEAPAGVGFSYSNDKSDYTTNDTMTAADNHKFLNEFFKFYPEFAQNELFISGESYAGVYVPTLVDHIYTSGDKSLNLKGFMVGNGCIGSAVGACSNQGTAISVDYLFAHGLYSKVLHDKIVADCPDLENPSIKCRAALQEMSNAVGNVNIYDIYGPCISGDGENDSASGNYYKVRMPNGALNPILEYSSASVKQNVGGPNECIDGILAGRYLNDPAVRVAIHVRPLNETAAWTICTGAINYTPNTQSLLPVYPTLIANYRTLIYSGDADCCVPYTASEAWTSGLGIPVAKEWHPWTVDDQVAGYATTYTVNHFTFVTVKGAGHMVPQTNGRQAFVMFQKFLANEPL